MFVLFSMFSNTFYALKELLWSLYTPYKGSICASSSKLYGWVSSESEGKRPKQPSLPHMRLWFLFGLNSSSKPGLKRSFPAIPTCDHETGNVSAVVKFVRHPFFLDFFTSTNGTYSRMLKNRD